MGQRRQRRISRSRMGRSGQGSSPRTRSKLRSKRWRPKLSSFKSETIVTSEWPTTHQKINLQCENCLTRSCTPLNFGVYASFMSGNNTSALFAYWVVKSRRGRTQFVFRFRFLFSASLPSYWEPCWQRNSRLAWPIGPCGCPRSCWWSSLCWIAQRFQASEVV